MSGENVSNYTEQGGSRTVIGGEIDITGTLKKSGTTISVTATEINNLAQSTTSGAIITGGVVAFTGSTVINTSMATVVAKVASQVSDPSVTNGQYVTVEDGDTAGWIRVKSWKPTAANNVEPAEGSASVTASWFALGSD